MLSSNSCFKTHVQLSLRVSTPVKLHLFEGKDGQASASASASNTTAAGGKEGGRKHPCE